MIDHLDRTMKKLMSVSTIRTFVAPAATILLGLHMSLTPAFGAALSDLYDEIKHAVVVIRTKERELSSSASRHYTSAAGVGSGFLISEDGKIMTAAHVVQTADEIEVELFNGQKSPAFVLTSIPPSDVALLQMERVPRAKSVARLGDSDKARIGEQVFVVGAPYGVSQSLTVGHISGRQRPNRAYGMFFDMEFLQTDAAINEGNSGGPMFNMDGEVIGICSYILSQSGGFEGLGFVASINFASKILLEGTGFWSGIEGIPVEGKLAQALNLNAPGGYLVQKVAEGSAGAMMGLRAGTIKAEIEGETVILGGDIVIEVLGIALTGPEGANEALKKVKSMAAGQMITAKVLRAGKIQDLATFVQPEL